MLKTRIKTDYIGASASLLCLLHCMATPFIFAVRTCSNTCCVDAPIWWQLIDYLFLVISFFAIYYATRESTKSWIRIALWSAWVTLLLTVMNETFKLAPLPERFFYIPSLVIVGLHLYNRRYCKCVGVDRCAT